MCWKRLQDMSWRRLEDVLKTNKCLLGSDNYFMTSGSLWNYYKDEVNDDTNGNNAANNRLNMIKFWI